MSSIKINSTDYSGQSRELLLKENPNKNVFALEAIDYISINTGVGRLDNAGKETVYNQILRLTAQKPKKIKSKISVSDFKLRKGDVVGVACTLRGQTMYDFLMQLIYLSLPRGRDFRGLKKSFDKTYKSYSIGLPTATIFPIIGFDADVDFGMQINIVFKSASKDNEKVLEAFNFPFVKN